MGRKTNLILPHLLKSITTFEIKLPSVQIIPCAMLGCYLGLGLSSSQWRDSCPLLCPAQSPAVTSVAVFLCALWPADSQEMLQGRKCGGPRTCQVIWGLSFVLKGILKLSS